LGWATSLPPGAWLRGDADPPGHADARTATPKHKTMIRMARRADVVGLFGIWSIGVAAGHKRYEDCASKAFKGGKPHDAVYCAIPCRRIPHSRASARRR